MRADIETVRVAIDRLEGQGSDTEWCGFIDALARIEALLTETEARAVRAEAVVEAARLVAKLDAVESTWTGQRLSERLAAYDAGQEGKPVSPSPEEPTG